MRSQINHIARLGPGAFQEITGEVVKAILFSSSKVDADITSTFFSVDVADAKTLSEKASSIPQPAVAARESGCTYHFG